MVALDLETTGLDPQRDAIIEVGAVKFQGRRVLGTYASLVNPYRPIPPFVERLTGIASQDVANAPPFSTVAGELADFVGELPIVGHSVQFDLAFLERNGLRFRAPSYDTLELAGILKPKGEYALAALAREFGVVNPRPHRGLADAGTAHLLLMGLVEVALALDPAVVEELHRLASVAGTPVRHLWRGVAAEQSRSAPRVSTLPPGGLDLAALQRRMDRAEADEAVSTAPRKAAFDEAEMAALLNPGGAASAVLSGYEERAEQGRMLQAVARTLEHGGQLMVEAGTGVGKSLAYLLPAAFFAAREGKRVVISTNTIGLQEQLITKDLPAVVRIMAAASRDMPGSTGLRFAQLKGRSNYLCMRRWGALRSSMTLSGDEAKVLGKLAVWLQGTASGDRNELRLPRGEAPVWERLSAQGAKGCPATGVPCFLESARSKAEQADIVVVNHALLLADLALGGGLIPEYDHVIVDEAHHIEAEATRQFGFAVTQDDVEAHLDTLGGPRGLATVAVGSMARAAPELTARRQVAERAAQRLSEQVAQARQKAGELFARMVDFLHTQSEGTLQGRSSLRLSHGTRAQPDWGKLEVAQETVGRTLRSAATAAGELGIALEGLEGGEVAQVRSELAAQVEMSGELVSRLEEFILQPSREAVYWLEEDAAGNLRLNRAPLRVEALLKQHLFDKKRSVVLTSATLSAAGSLAPMKALLGVPDAEELVLGSPFDYPRLALVCAPPDMPEPSSPRYEQALVQALAELARAAQGRTMALFTSYASLRAVATQVRGPLEAEGIRVLAQSVDGSAAQLLERFQADPKALLLGAASFWEGVDLVGDQLQVLVLVRLPFAVPTDPVFAARSETFDDPFSEYALPQAILRFRQGFGRLIRSSSDRGAVAVLDSRFLSRAYGQAFRASLPPARIVTPPLAELGGVVRAWLRGR